MVLHSRFNSIHFIPPFDFSIDHVPAIFPKVQAALDFETTQSYSLTLTVSDSGGSSGNVVINIAVDDVNDNAPVCQDAAVVRDVDEGVTTGSIYTPTCSDPVRRVTSQWL